MTPQGRKLAAFLGIGFELRLEGGELGEGRIRIRLLFTPIPEVIASLGEIRTAAVVAALLAGLLKGLARTALRAAMTLWTFLTVLPWWAVGPLAAFAAGTAMPARPAILPIGACFARDHARFCRYISRLRGTIGARRSRRASRGGRLRIGAGPVVTARALAARAVVALAAFVSRALAATLSSRPPNFDELGFLGGEGRAVLMIRGNLNG
jgi:hypothetical protein